MYRAPMGRQPSVDNQPGQSLRRQLQVTIIFYANAMAHGHRALFFLSATDSRVQPKAQPE
jgi:hypothetical protein